MSRIIRRFHRPTNVTTAMPACVALAMDTRGGLKKTEAMAYVGLAATNLGITYMKFREDQGIISKAQTMYPDADFSLTGKLPSMMHTLWMDHAYRGVPGALVDSRTCPQHDLLIDETVEALDVAHVRFTATAFRLGLETRHDETNVEVVDIPADDIDLMMGMVGSVTIEIKQGKISFDVLGEFAEPKCEEILKRISALDIPEISDDDSDDE